MKLIEVKKNKKTLLVGSGIQEDIKTPIEITFTIDQDNYISLDSVAKEYKWSIYEALSCFCEYAPRLIPELENMIEIENTVPDGVVP